jgi:hypothetical protein
LHAETGGLRHVTPHADFVADEFTHVRGSIRHGVANRMIVSRGVNAGAIIPYHVLDSNPGCRHVPLS